MPDRAPERPPSRLRVIARRDDWQLVEFVCTAGPEDRPFEEWHQQVSVAAVVEGSFNYRTDTGRALLYPGSILLGNPGTCFECGHDHSTGDRCVSLQMHPELFGEVAATHGGGSGFRFRSAMLPASDATTALVVRLEAAALQDRPGDLDAMVLETASGIAAAASGHVAKRVAVGARDLRRVSDVVRHIELNATEPVELERLADIARLSKFHFLRVFRSVVGMTPYQFLLNVRMRRAATRLETTADPIATIAFDAGFGDLSTFNRRFRAQFGKSPSGWRG